MKKVLVAIRGFFFERGTAKKGFVIAQLGEAEAKPILQKRNF
jgi:hypothetical protein